MPLSVPDLVTPVVPMVFIRRLSQFRTGLSPLPPHGFHSSRLSVPNWARPVVPMFFLSLPISVPGWGGGERRTPPFCVLRPLRERRTLPVLYSPPPRERRTPSVLRSRPPNERRTPPVLRSSPPGEHRTPAVLRSPPAMRTQNAPRSAFAPPRANPERPPFCVRCSLRTPFAAPRGIWTPD